MVENVLNKTTSIWTIYYYIDKGLFDLKVKDPIPIYTIKKQNKVDT